MKKVILVWLCFLPSFSIFSQILTQNFLPTEYLGKGFDSSKYNLNCIAGLKNLKKDSFKFIRDEFTIAKNQNQLKLLNGQQTLEQFDSTLEKLEIKKLEKIRQIKTIIAKNINKQTIFLPTRNTETTALYYSKSSSNLSFLNENKVGVGANNGSFSNNLISGYGAYFQLSFLSNLTRANIKEFISDSVKKFVTNAQFVKYATSIDSINKSNSTLVKVASGGGEGTLKLRTTVLDYNYNSGNRIIGVRSEISNKLSFDIPIAGSYLDSKKSSIFNFTSVNTSLVIRLKENSDFMKKSAFTIYLNYEIARIGGTSQFYKNLNMNDKDKKLIESHFWLQDINVGFMVDNFNFFYTKQLFNKLDNNNVSGRFGLKINNILGKN